MGERRIMEKKVGRKPLNGVSTRVYKVIAIDEKDKKMLRDYCKENNITAVDLIHNYVTSLTSK